MPAVRGDIGDPPVRAWRATPGCARWSEQELVQRLSGDRTGKFFAGLEWNAINPVLPMDRKLRDALLVIDAEVIVHAALAIRSGSPAGSKVFGSTRTRMNSFCPVVV